MHGPLNVHLIRRADGGVSSCHAVEDNSVANIIGALKLKLEMATLHLPPRLACTIHAGNAVQRRQLIYLTQASKSVQLQQTSNSLYGRATFIAQSDRKKCIRKVNE